MADLPAPPALKRHVPDLWPEIEHLLEAGEDVESLRSALGWSHVCALIDAEIATVQRGLDQSAHRYSHPELTYAHGRLSGLKAIRDAAEAISSSAARRRQEQAAKHERDELELAQEG